MEYLWELRRDQTMRLLIRLQTKTLTESLERKKMQTLNLRNKRKESEKIVTEVWEKRLKLCQLRKLNEQEVEDHNKKVATLLKEILVPVSHRIQMPLQVEICEGETKVNVDFVYPTRTSVLKPRVTLSFPNIYEILSNKKKMTENVKKMESQIRLLKKAVGQTEKVSTVLKKNTLQVYHPGSVSVKFSTRTRYF